jgi:hypothetical protein
MVIQGIRDSSKREVFAKGTQHSSCDWTSFYDVSNDRDTPPVEIALVDSDECGYHIRM